MPDKYYRFALAAFIPLGIVLVLASLYTLPASFQLEQHRGHLVLWASTFFVWFGVLFCAGMLLPHYLYIDLWLLYFFWLVASASALTGTGSILLFLLVSVASFEAKTRVEFVAPPSAVIFLTSVGGIWYFSKAYREDYLDYVAVQRFEESQREAETARFPGPDEAGFYADRQVDQGSAEKDQAAKLQPKPEAHDLPEREE